MKHLRNINWRSVVIELVSVAVVAGISVALVVAFVHAWDAEVLGGWR